MLCPGCPVNSSAGLWNPALHLSSPLQSPGTPAMPPINAIGAREKIDVRNTASTLNYTKVFKGNEIPVAANILWALIKCYARHFISFNLHNHFTKGELLMGTFYRWEHWSLKRLTNVAMATQGAEPIPPQIRLSLYLTQSCSVILGIWIKMQKVQWLTASRFKRKPKLTLTARVMHKKKRMSSYSCSSK